MKIIFSLTLFVCCMVLRAVDVGGMLHLDDIIRKTDPVLGKAAPCPGGIEVILFFDASAPDAVPCLRMIENLQSFAAEKNQKIAFFCLSRVSADITKQALEQANIQVPVSADRNKSAFLEYIREEILLPVVLVVKEDQVRWKGTPAELESVLGRMEKGTFSMDRQRLADRYRNDLKRGIQASLPAVILQSADQILQILPDDMIAIQAKLFVYGSTRQTKAAVDFLSSLSSKSPDNLNISIMYLDWLIRSNDCKTFRSVFCKMLTQFQKSPESIFRILLFVVPNAPFAWLPLNECEASAASISQVFCKNPGNKSGTVLELQARIAYLRADPAAAVRYQENAMKYLTGKQEREAGQRYLEYYKSVKK